MISQIYVLTQTDGYSIQKLGQSVSKTEMQKQMQEEYQRLYPYDTIETNDTTWNDFKEMSECNEDNAILYDRGETVYVWQILTVDMTDLTKSIPVDISIAPLERSPEYACKNI